MMLALPLADMSEEIYLGIIRRQDFCVDDSDEDQGSG